jgi:polyphosphate glucokinase
VAASVRDKKDLSWKEWGGRLKDYVHTLEKLLWPELIIVGGGVSAKHDKFFKFIKPRAKLVPAEFLNQAGIAGAAIWATEKR